MVEVVVVVVVHQFSVLVVIDSMSISIEKKWMKKRKLKKENAEARNQFEK